MRKAPFDWMVAMGSNAALHIYYETPTVIVVAGRMDAISPLVDVCAAIENMLIAAESLGIGACWIGFTKFFFNGPDSYRKLGIPEGYEVQYGVALGYRPAGPAAKPPARKRERYYHVIKYSLSLDVNPRQPWPRLSSRSPSPGRHSATGPRGSATR
jgi:nitroreductase